ncbi:MAG: HEXXH motif-containing putative peptide modification protein [Polyangiales bacterium]
MSSFVPSPPVDLTIPTGNSTTGRAILSMALRRLFEDLKQLRLEGLPPDLAADYRLLRKTLVSFLPGKPGAIASLLRSPSVAAPLRCLRNGSGDRETCVAEVVNQSFFQLHIQGAIDADIQLQRRVPLLLAPLFGQSATGVHALSELDVRSNLFARVSDEDEKNAIYLATGDNNPLRLVEAHPDKSGNQIDLGEKDVATWVAALREALALIERFLPAIRREASLFVRQFVPVGYDPESHLSATYREAIGTVYLSLHPDPLMMAEAIIHELSHTKLHALLELDAVLENDPREAYPSPVRPDPRPLMGVLLAVHAFVPVAYLYDKIAEAGDPLSKVPTFSRRRAEIIGANADGAAVIEAHARPTPIGKGLLDEIKRWTSAAAPH